MATGDVIERVDNNIGSSTSDTSTIAFSSTPPEGSAIILWYYARSVETVSTPPSGFTQLELSSGGYPRIVAYAKIAGASESNSYAIVWSSTTKVAAVGYNIEGTLTLGEISSDINASGAQSPFNIPDSPLSSTTNGLAIALMGNYAGGTADHSFDNSFIIRQSSTIGAAAAYAYADKAITHPDTDIQSLVTFTDGGSNGKGILVLIEPSVGGATITSTDTPVARGETNVAINGSGFGASQGSGTVTYGTKSCTVTSWSDTVIEVTIPSTIALQHDATGYTFIVTADDTSSDTSSAVPFNAPSGWSYTDLTSPVTTEGSILYGYTGDTPVTGDQAVYTTPTSPDNITFTVEADGEWVLDSTPTQNQTVSIYVIQADGTLGTTQEVIYSIGVSTTTAAKNNVFLINYLGWKRNVSR